MQLSASQINSLLKEQEQKQAEIDKLDAAIEEHRKGIDLVQKESDQEVSAYQDLVDKNAALAKRNQGLIEEYTNLSSRLTAAKQSMADTQLTEDVIRNDIASRTRALDEREKTLIRREQKVTESERIVQQNSAYLNL